MGTGPFRPAVNGPVRRTGTALLAAFAAASAAAAPAPATLYVATDGNDAWSGRLAAPNRARTDGPLATLAAARDRLRLLRRRGRGEAAAAAAGPATVAVRGGTYYLAEPLTLGPEDSGAPGAPVTYAAYPGEHPVLSGGLPVTGWRRGEDGLWVADAPPALKGGTLAAGLMVGGGRRRQTVLPAGGGFYRIAERVPPADPKQPDDRFRFAPGDVRADWRNLPDVDVLCFHVWSASRVPVAAVDPATNTVSFAGHGPSAASWGRMNAGDRYRVENVFEALPGEPGACYLDRASGRLYYHPLPGERLAGFSAVAPRLERLVVFRGDAAAAKRWVTDVTLRGLTLRDTGWPLPPGGHAAPQAEVDLGAAVEGVGARDCRLEDCEIAHTGAYAVQWGRGCRRDALVGCDLHDLGGGGVKIGETGIPADPDDLASDNVVRDCRIHDGGVLHPAAVGVWIGQSPGNRIVHDTIHDLYYTGVSIGWTWGYGDARARDNAVEYCDIYDIGRGLLSDMGGIYTLGDQRGSRLTHNRIRDVESATYGGWGIYFDEGTTGIRAEDNVVYRTKTGGFHQHYGKDNVVRNNVFALSKEAQLQRTRAEDHLSFTFERNVVYWDSGNLLANNWKDGQFAMDRNLYWDARPGAAVTFAGLSWDDWRKTGHDAHSVIADPRLADPADPARDDFRLRRDSPAFALGFRPIDLRGVGATKKQGKQQAKQ